MTKKITIDDDMVRRAIREAYGALASGTDMFHKTNMDWYRRVLDAALNPPHEHKWLPCGTTALLPDGHTLSTPVQCDCGALKYDERPAVMPFPQAIQHWHARKGDARFTARTHQRSADRKPDSTHHTHKRSTDQS